jgi:hypothetical protein
MIVPDSKKRATIAEIKDHPWVKIHTSPPLLATPAVPVPRAKPKITMEAIDEEIVAKLKQLGFDEKEVTKSLLENNTLSQSYFLYTLMLREKIKQKEAQQNQQNALKPSTPPNSILKNYISTKITLQL